jgi:hypothetical protein
MIPASINAKLQHARRVMGYVQQFAVTVRHAP